MITEEHIRRSLERTGKDWKEMHCWLDNCDLDPWRNHNVYPMQHRVERHTPQGLDYILNMWGPEGLIEAVQHMREDGYNIFLSQQTGNTFTDKDKNDNKLESINNTTEISKIEQNSSDNINNA